MTGSLFFVATMLMAYPSFDQTFKPELRHLMQFLMRFEQQEIRAKRHLLLSSKVAPNFFKPWVDQTLLPVTVSMPQKVGQSIPPRQV